MDAIDEAVEKALDAIDEASIPLDAADAAEFYATVARRCEEIARASSPIAGAR